MNLERYTGYNLTLYTDLGVEECAGRLRTDFKTPRLRIPRETVSDKNLAGRITARHFSLELNKKRLIEGVEGSNILYRRRLLEATLTAEDAGTRIKGRYGYGVGVLLTDVAVLASAIIIGAVLLIFGLVSALRGNALALLLTVVGPFVVLVTYSSLRQPSDDEIIEEKDFIASYLENLLEAKVMIGR